MTGPPPSPRTFHTSSAAIGDQLYVFGGGERGAQPVQDVQLHVFDASMNGVGDPCFMFFKTYPQTIICQAAFSILYAKCHMSLPNISSIAVPVAIHFIFNCLFLHHPLWGFPGGSEGKESSYNAGDPSLILGLGRSPRGGHGNPLQYFCLENPHGQRSLEGYIQSIGSQRIGHIQRLSTAQVP